MGSGNWTFHQGDIIWSWLDLAGGFQEIGELYFVNQIQKFILYLGHPLYSFSVTLFSLLFSSGLGSLLSKKILGKNIIKNLRWCFFVCAVLILVFFFVFPAIQKNLIGFNLGYRIFLTFLSIFPIGFLMGFPFPSGIRILEQTGKKWIPWAWAINAFSSVVNSVAALLIAFIGGYSLVLLLAGAGYLCAPLFLNFTPKTRSPTWFRGDTQNVFTIKKLDVAKIIDALRLIAASVKIQQLSELLG